MTIREPIFLTPLEGWPAHLLRHGVIATVVSLVLAVIGPFGTFTDFGLGGRLVYWTLMILPGFVVYEVVVRVAFALRTPTRGNWWKTLIAAELVGSVFQTAVVLTVERSARDILPLTIAGIAEVYVYVVVLTVVTAALPMWIELRRYGAVFGIVPAFVQRYMPVPAAGTGGGETYGEANSPAATAFLRRIPERLGQDLLALEMEDHYVRIHTLLGSDLVLMRLRDAVVELAGLPGLQVHRSYWVAAEAVAEVERTESGKLTLVLRNGMKVPVSRTFTSAVRAAGWLERTGRRAAV